MLDAGCRLSFPVLGNARRPADSFFTLAGSTRFADDSQPPTRGAKVWEGKNLSAEWSNTTVRLYSSGWTNPHPEKKVAHIDFLTAGTQAAPFCLAITVEEPVSR